MSNLAFSKQLSLISFATPQNNSNISVDEETIDLKNVLYVAYRNISIDISIYCCLNKSSIRIHMFRRHVLYIQCINGLAKRITTKYTKRTRVRVNIGLYILYAIHQIPSILARAPPGGVLQHISNEPRIMHVLVPRCPSHSHTQTTVLFIINCLGDKFQNNSGLLRVKNRKHAAHVAGTAQPPPPK